MPGENVHKGHASSERDLRLLMASSSLRPASALDHNNHSNKTWRQRPRSTPLTASHRIMTPLQSQNMPRPKTATVIRDSSQCDRVRQLDHEPMRRHKLESHLPLKRTKPPPWQNIPENPVVNFQVGHGYILSRSKTRNHVTITDDLFEPSLQDHYRKEIPSYPERDDLIVQLQQQISDLILYLEEERFSHKQTKQRAEELLRDRIDQMNSQFQDKSREIVADHNEELLKQKQTMEAHYKEVQDTLENQISRMAKDIEYLQSAFACYKGTLNTEATQKLNTKDDEQRLRFAEEKQQAIHEMKTRFIHERNQERTNLVKEHQKAIEALRKENKKELESLLRRFSSAATDIEKLKETTAELDKTKSELEMLKESYSSACQKLTNITNQLTDAKVQLLDFEKRFEDKVSNVDDKYKFRLQELMTQNTELKRMFVQKCGQLFEEKANSEYQTTQRVKSAKEALEMLVKSKQPANSSTTFGEAVHVVGDSLSQPMRAQGTRDETAIAQKTDGDVIIQSSSRSQSSNSDI